MPSDWEMLNINAEIYKGPSHPLPTPALCAQKEILPETYHMEITTHSINYSLWGRDMWHILQNQLKRQKIQSPHYVFSPDTAR